MDKTNKEEENLLSLERSRYQFKALTGHQTLSASMEEKDDIEGKKISTGWEDDNWFLAMKTRSGNKTNTRRFPPNMSKLNREGMERTDHVTRSDVHKKSSLDGQTMKRSLEKRFERNSWKSPKNHREPPGRQQGLDWGTLQEEGLTQIEDPSWKNPYDKRLSQNDRHEW